MSVISFAEAGVALQPSFIPNWVFLVMAIAGVLLLIAATVRVLVEGDATRPAMTVFGISLALISILLAIGPFFRGTDSIFPSAERENLSRIEQHYNLASLKPAEWGGSSDEEGVYAVTYILKNDTAFALDGYAVKTGERNQLVKMKSHKGFLVIHNQHALLFNSKGKGLK